MATALNATQTQNTEGFWLRGEYSYKDDKTFLQDAARAAVLAKYTVVATQQSSGKLVPLSDINPALTSASLACGVNGGLIAAYQNADSEFSITVDGQVLDIQVDMTAITALTDIAPAINTIGIPLGVICTYNEETNTFYFSSLKKGLPASTITVLSAVSGGTGTDISGATHLNGLTGTGAVTAATGEASTSIPSGIFLGTDITAAALVAGDVTDQAIAIVGEPADFDDSKIVLEGSLTLDSVVAATGKTIRQHLHDIGFIASTASEIFQTQPLT
jgi:hypothetical protein